MAEPKKDDSIPYVGAITVLIPYVYCEWQTYGEAISRIVEAFLGLMFHWAFVGLAWLSAAFLLIGLGKAIRNRGEQKRREVAELQSSLLRLSRELEERQADEQRYQNRARLQEERIRQLKSNLARFHRLLKRAPAHSTASYSGPSAEQTNAKLAEVLGEFSGGALS